IKGVSGTTPPLNWWSYYEHINDPGITYQIPDYYAYFNRFWCRAAGKYTCGLHVGQAYNPKPVVGGLPANGVENLGMYPQTFQYFGQFPPSDFKWMDRIMDFPFNTLEDQAGCEWRYLSGA